MTWTETHPLLMTKLFMPLSHSPLVDRPRLWQVLDQGRPLTIVVGGAGWGKSTLLAQWAASQPGPVGWVSLDASDNDAIRFLIYCVAAWQQIDPALDTTLLAELQAPQPPTALDFLTRIANALASRHASNPVTPLTLILDDFHVLETPEVLEIAALLFERLPPSARVVLAARNEPALPLARWRVRGRLAELHTDQLRFTPAESVRFFQETLQLNLPPGVVDVLEQRTEGWIAGLHLAGLLASTHPDPARFVAEFGGNHRFVLDYLAEEVLRQQAAPIQQFLLATSILDEMCAPLCAAVLDEPDAGAVQALLEELERANLFVVPLDAERRWFRYHHLFAELLRYRLAQSQAGLIPLLHRRASAWLMRTGRIDAAVVHSVHADDLPTAEELIVEHARGLLMRGEAHTVLAWMRHLPEALIRQSARLAVPDAWARLVLVQPALVAERLHWAEAHIGQLGVAEARRIHDEMLVIRAILPRFTNDIQQSIALSQAALRQIDPTDTVMRGVAAGNLAVVLTIVGDIEGASSAAAVAVSATQASGNMFGALLAIGDLGLLQWSAGRLQAAVQTFQQGLRLAQAQGWQHIPAMGTILMGLAQVHYEWNELDVAEEHVIAGIAVARAAGYLDIMTDALLVQARLLEARHDFGAAEQVLAEADQVAHRNNVVRFINRVRSQQIQLALLKRDLPQALLLLRDLPLDTSGDLDPELAPEYIVILNVLIQRRDYSAALDLSERLEAMLGGRISSRLQVLVLRAQALLAQHQTSRAQTVLEQALGLAEEGGYVRAFLNGGAELAAHLQQHIGATAHRAYVSRLLADWLAEGGRAARSAQALIDPLSDREREVLHLMAAGLSNRTIADQLVISVGTVKRHVINIFSKMDVHSRTAAVARARDLDLLA